MKDKSQKIEAPKISVLMPIYKTQKAHLAAAIESVLAQTFKDFEFLILDDCPEDNREQFVSSYDDKRIKYIKNEQNMGITKARNKLIGLAKGEYLAVMDHDDISLKDRFEKQAAYLDANPDVGVVSGQAETFGRKSKISKNLAFDDDIKLDLMHRCALMHSASMIRKSVLTDYGVSYEERFSPAEDYGLWCNLIKHTKFHNLPDVVLKYRDYGDNTSKHQTDKMTVGTCRVWSFVRAEYPALWEEFCLRATRVHDIRLFGFIPFLKILRGTKKTKIYLFSVILLLSYKSRFKLKGK